MIRYEAIKTQVNAQNIYYEIAMQFAESIVRVWG